MKNRIKIAGIIATITLAGCQTVANMPLTHQDKMSLQNMSREFGTTVGFADAIASACPRYVLATRTRGALLNHPVVQDMKNRGISQREIEAFVKGPVVTREMNQMYSDYLNSRNIDLNVPETFCRAGDYEKVNHTAIGNLLIRR